MAILVWQLAPNGQGGVTVRGSLHGIVCVNVALGQELLIVYPIYIVYWTLDFHTYFYIVILRVQTQSCFFFDLSPEALDQLKDLDHFIGLVGHTLQ
jgi:hypothetical protein